jgi:hypothetical protein
VTSRNEPKRIAATDTSSDTGGRYCSRQSRHCFHVPGEKFLATRRYLRLPQRGHVRQRGSGLAMGLMISDAL